MAGLRELWTDVIPDAGELADDLVGRYAGKSRYVYRDRYLETVLIALESLDQLSTDPTAVRLAAWFHRAVHQPGSTAQEDAEDSAQMVEQVLPAYGVTPARTAEVARLVRLTGGSAPVKTQDANADVLLDAVNAILADKRYPTHAGEVRRDAEREAEDPSAEKDLTAADIGAEDHSADRPFAEVKRRYDEISVLLTTRIYRTQLGRDRYEAVARANLTVELATVDALLPAPWRGWQRAALVVTTVVTAFLALVVAFAASRVPWRTPEFSGDSVWPSVVLTILALAAVPALYRSSRRSTRQARVAAGLAIVTGVVGVVAVWITTPETNAASGVGERVPLVVIASVLLVVAGAACLGASVLSGRPDQVQNRGQVLAGFGAIAAIVLVGIFVVNPLQRTYLLDANEQLEGPHQPANLNVGSELTGGVAWTNRSSSGSLDSLTELVATRHGFALSPRPGTIEMLDPATGQVRWRYSRSDTDEHAHLYAVSGGELLLASFDDAGFFVLDADTGRRKAAWPGRTRDYDIQNRDPLVTGLTVSKGSDKLFGTNVDGTNRWTYKPGTCTGISAAATADTVIAGLRRSCGGESNELVGLNLRNGKKLWSHPVTFPDGMMAVGGTIVGVEPENGGTVEGRGTLVGLDPRSGDAKWRWTMPTRWACPPRMEWAGNLVLLISCPDAAEALTHTVVTAIDSGTGRMAWSATAATPADRRYAVTTDARVVFVGDTTDSCRLTSIGEHKVSYLTMTETEVPRCGRVVAAADNLILVSGDDSIVALK